MNTKLPIALLLASVATSSAHAQMADTAAGARRAAVCFACHGGNGHAKVPGYPNLAAQDRQYLEKQLRAFRDGQRKDPTMSAMSAPLSDADIANIAAYFSTQE